ncbi:hypothetical protein [Paenibacillus daejeonensis]|uniref:hypothetical protein n=1 Tax=Paenibacillus daejeonensis TaxID=135193 RepID=UPI0003788838|nr:hypothetical protein [Paenibacillus daejeonensis]
MEKSCPCGETMSMKLRTVIYSGKVEIDNVPVYSCDACSRSEVFPEVKPDLTGLIGQLGAKPEQQTFLFNEWNEWADLIMELYTRQKRPSRQEMDKLIGERINKLLDLLLLAQRLGDDEWIAEVEKRLSQISRRTMST